MNNDENKWQFKVKVLLIWAVVFLMIGPSNAQYKINKHSINSGGGISTGSSHQVTGSIGQANTTRSSAANGYKVSGGFWAADNNSDLIFKSSFE